jgi:hypothetical protein
MESMTLLAMRTELIYEAGLDGQTASTGRHTETRLTSLLNRFWSSCRHMVANEGLPWFNTLGSITAIPAATTNEDFIDVALPTDAADIVGVDVKGTRTAGKWKELDKATWAQRRSLNLADETPGHGVGWFAVQRMPEAIGAATITPGVVSLFPPDLAGSYRISYLQHWTPLVVTSGDTHLFVGTSDMFTWTIAQATMAVIGRDSNKKQNAQRAMLAIEGAEARLREQARRAGGAGRVVPKRAGGELFR